MNDSYNLRMTESRKAIMSALCGARWHPTADEVYLTVRKVVPRVSLATVYRNLDFLAKAGMIRTVAVAGEQRRYDGSLSEHHHIRCSVCGRIDDVDLVHPLNISELLSNDERYDVQGYTLCFVGVCKECSGNGDARNG